MVVVVSVVAVASGVVAVVLAEVSGAGVEASDVVVVVVVAWPVASGAAELGGSVVVVGVLGAVCPGVVAGAVCADAGSATASAPPAMATDKSLKCIINSST